MNCFLVRAGDGDVNVEETAFCDLKGEAQLGSCLDAIEEALLGVGVNHEKVGLRGGYEGPK